MYLIRHPQLTGLHPVLAVGRTNDLGLHVFVFSFNQANQHRPSVVCVLGQFREVIEYLSGGLQTIDDLRVYYIYPQVALGLRLRGDNRNAIIKEPEVNRAAPCV
jgi:hypothetical protein